MQEKESEWKILGGGCWKGKQIYLYGNKNTGEIKEVIGEPNVNL